MPSPTASNLGDTGLKALMTFGTIASTPVALRGPSDPARPPSQAVSDALQEGPFKIPAAPRREMLAHKMAGKATKSLQQRHGLTFANSGLGLRRNLASVRGGSTPGTPTLRDGEEGSTTPGRDAYLSPAAKRLLVRTTASGKIAASPLSGPTPKREADERERLSMERFKRQRW
jgi:protein DGCR14